jgi:hypothetical protein
MALLNDRLISIEDLCLLDSSVLEVASTEGIDLTVKLQSAVNDIRMHLTKFFSVRQNHATASVAAARTVMTEPLKKWVTLHALALTYQDAQHNQMNERYEKKASQYARLAHEARLLLFASGVGQVVTPLPRAAAPILATIGGSAPQGVYYVQVNWVGKTGEGAASEVLTADVTANTTLGVEMSSEVPAGVTGWNVFVGLSPTELLKQNASALAVGLQWILPASGLSAGLGPGTGQQPEFWVTDAHVLGRG